MIQALKLAICHDKTFSLDQLGMSKTPVSKRWVLFNRHGRTKGLINKIIGSRPNVGYCDCQMNYVT